MTSYWCFVRLCFVCLCFCGREMYSPKNCHEKIHNITTLFTVVVVVVVVVVEVDVQLWLPTVLYFKGHSAFTSC